MIELPAGLAFKTVPSVRLLAEFRSGQLCPILYPVLAWLCEKRLELLSRDTIVTCIWRSAAEEKALRSKTRTHFGWRAIDLRVEQEFRPIEEQLRRELNAKFPTDVKGMPRCAPLNHGTGLHYHLQATLSEKAGKIWARAGALDSDRSLDLFKMGQHA